jgi:hypothetical protein
MLSAQEALVYTMVAAAEADHEIDDAEIRIIGDLVNHLPIFRGLDRGAATRIATACSKLLAEAGGRDRVFVQIREGIRAQLEVEPAMARAIEQVAKVRFQAA